MAIPPTVGNGPFAAKSKQSSSKTIVLIFAVFCIQVGFIFSYVGAFHAPKPDAINILVVALPAGQAQLVSSLNGIEGNPILALPAHSATSAMAQLKTGEISGIFTYNPTGTTDRLTVATAGGASVATALETVLQQASASQQRAVRIVDAVPVQSGDARGLTGFYMVAGWLIGGYLLAAVLGILLGTALTGARQAMNRIAIFVPYAILSGIGGAAIVNQGLNAITGHFWAIASLGALIVLAGAMVTVALQAFLGIIGIGISIIIFVVLGNPSAGGAYQQQLLPIFWQTISQALPNGAGTSALRQIVYFNANNITGHILLIAAYAASGIGLIFIAALRRARTTMHPSGQLQP